MLRDRLDELPRDLAGAVVLSDDDARGSLLALFVQGLVPDGSSVAAARSLVLRLPGLTRLRLVFFMCSGAPFFSSVEASLFPATGSYSGTARPADPIACLRECSHPIL